MPRLEDKKIGIREQSLEWFFKKNEAERINLKERHFKDQYIEYTDKWGYHFNLGQIEEMYIKEIEKNEK